MYRLIILPPAARFLKKLKEKPLKIAFQKAVDEILKNPYIGEPKTGDLSGIFCYDIYYSELPSTYRGGGFVRSLVVFTLPLFSQDGSHTHYWLSASQQIHQLLCPKYSLLRLYLR